MKAASNSLLRREMPKCVRYGAQTISNQAERFTSIPFANVKEELPAVPDFSGPFLFPILPLRDWDKQGGNANEDIA